MELDDADTEAKFQYGLALARAGVMDEAIKKLTEVVEADPEHADAFYNLGVAYSGMENQLENALEYFNKALAIQPDHILASNGKKLVEQALKEQD